MSATFRLGAKKKYTQNDLRKLMTQQKSISTEATATKTKIDSPLAKYNELGQLTCVLCKSIVRSEDVWKIHINAKQHKQNIELAKALKEKGASQALKRPAPTSNVPPAVPEKMPRGILKNSITPKNSSAVNVPTTETRQIPSDFFDENSKSAQSKNYFDAALQKSSINRNLVSIKRNVENKQADATNEAESNEAADEAIPEGFFDDPIKDAKARNVDYKNPIEEEWEQFQQEIKEAANFSNAIIAEDQEQSIVERQIDEIDEQIRNWSRVLELEKKKEEVQKRDKKIEKKSTAMVFKEELSDGDDNSSDSIEYLDWRAKRAH